MESSEEEEVDEEDCDQDAVRVTGEEVTAVRGGQKASADATRRKMGTRLRRIKYIFLIFFFGDGWTFSLDMESINGAVMKQQDRCASSPVEQQVEQ